MMGEGVRSECVSGEREQEEGQPERREGEGREGGKGMEGGERERVCERERERNR